MVGYKGKCIYATKNAKHSIEVYENFSYRWLSFGSHYIQSIIHKRKPHKAILKYIPKYCLFTHQRDSNALLLGVGGGALSHRLHHCYPNLTLHAVDYDEEIIAISREFFKLNTISHLQLFHADAQHFIQQTNAHYTRIFIDLYTDYDYPSHCADQDFFAQCKQRLAHNGVLSLNIVNFKKQQCLLTTLKSVFNNQVVAMPIANCGNIVAHAAVGNPMLLHLQALRHSKQIKSIQWNQTLGLTAY